MTTTLSEPDLVTRRRAEILTGAITVIARDGVSAAKLRDIAQASGVSLGLIQHYFETRENLVDSAFEVMMQVVTRATAEHTGRIDDPLESLYALVRLHVFGTVTFPERWSFWGEMWSASGRSEHLRTVSAHIYALWSSPIEEAFAALHDHGQLPSGIDLDGLVTGLLALMDGLAIRSIAEPDAFTSERMLTILNGWVTAALNVDRNHADSLTRGLAETDAKRTTRPLTPELVAEALAG